MMKISLLLAFAALLIGTHSLSGEERVFKKYAMLKIYESCFGQEVTKIVRKEMKEACAKCNSAELPPPPPPVKSTTTHAPPVQNEATESENSIYNTPSSFDPEKLHQAIFAYRPNSFPPPSFRPFPGAGLQGIYPPFANQMSFQPQPMFYPGYQQAPFSPFNVPVVAQPFYGNRVSRDMAFHTQDDFTSKFGSKTKNITCLMQELGYLDQNLMPNYEKIGERISNLPISQELRADILEGLAFCQQFTQCIPEVNRKKSPLSRELMRPMFFFKCYKHKKLEACMMKDIRERFTSEEDFDEDIELKRAGKSMRLSDVESEPSPAATSMIEYLLDDDSAVDLDAIL